jgi:dihydrofolate synthase / folylpolyglutamate synthase
MNFQESLDYLYRLGNEVLAMKLGLAATEKLLAALGNPQNNYLKVQIAGTNGKGSTCAFLESICRQAGIEVGMTTSPHLISITERVRINGREISEKDFARHATLIRETAEKLVAAGELETAPTFFEQVTVIALNAFAEARIKLAVLETGLGGRFDATTAARAEIAALTPIDFDHQKILGDTLAEIAAEKAAIIRENTQRVLIAPQKREAEQVLKGKCRESGVEPIWATNDIKIKKYDEDPAYPIRSISFKTARGNYPNIVLGLAGNHQTVNASLAIAVAEILRDDYEFKISDDDIWLGLETARHRGRLEFWRNFLFDGAHNIAGAKALREYLDEFVHQPITLIFGAMRDKDLSEIAEILFPKAENLILTRPDNPRSMEIAELMSFVPVDFDKEKIIAAETVEKALSVASRHSMNGIICVTGSLYLVGEAQKILQERNLS